MEIWKRQARADRTSVKPKRTSRRMLSDKVAHHSSHVVITSTFSRRFTLLYPSVCTWYFNLQSKNPLLLFWVFGSLACIRSAVIAKPFLFFHSILHFPASCIFTVSLSAVHFLIIILSFTLFRSSTHSPQ